MKKVLLIAYSTILILIWGLTFFDAGTVNVYSTFIGLAFTLYTYFLLSRSETYLKTKYAWVYISLGPLFYLALYFGTGQMKTLEVIFNPILWAIIFLIISTFLTSLSIAKTSVVLAFLCYIYSFHIFPIYQRAIRIQTNTVNLKKSASLKNHNLRDYKFLNGDSSYQRLDFDSLPILIETWNEKCGPCIQSINRLEEFIEQNTSFKHIYLYVEMGSANLKPDQVFKFKHIKNHDKILIDLDNNFYDEIKMDSYPYFLIYDRRGKLVSHFVGYHDKVLTEVKNELKEFSKKLR